MAKTKASEAKVPAGILCSASVGKTQIGKVNYSELPPITQERWCSMKNNSASHLVRRRTKINIQEL